MAENADAAAALAARVEGLAARGLVRETLEATAELVERFGGDPDPGVRVHVCTARSYAAVTLMGAGRLQDAVALFDEVVRTCGGDAPGLRRVVAASLATEAQALARLGRPDRALAALDDLDARGVDLDGLPAIVAEVWFARGLSLRLAGKLDDATASHGEVVRRFADSPSPEARAFAAGALHDTAGIWQQRATEESDERQLEVYDAVAARFGDDDAPGVAAVVASSLLSRANRLRSSGDEAGATAAYEEVVRRYGDVDHAQVRQVVAQAASALADGGEG